MMLVTSRRDDAGAKLEALWGNVRRLASSTDSDAARGIALSISDAWRDVERDYPLRRTGANTQRTTGARFGLVVAVGALLLTQAQPAPSSTDAQSLLSRGQPDSALMVLEARQDSTAGALVLTAQAHVQLGSRSGIGSRIRAARRSHAAFSAALARDTTNPDALESLAWMARLLPPAGGGDRAEADRLMERLEKSHPYRGALLRGHFARTDARNAAAESVYRQLVTSYPDSAPAWFALFDLSYHTGRSDVARDALRRYIALAPTDRAALFHRGELAATLGVELSEGETALREYLKGPFLPAMPPKGQSWWRLGLVLEKQGKIEPAREAYQKAVDVDGRDKDYRGALDSLNAAHPRQR
jgi:tetratricopeptide (TPR) repeat protein